MSVELAFAPITELAEGLRNGAISATQLVELYARRIEKLSDSSRAFISLDLEHACEQAAVIDATADNDTPLSGIPYACKDLFDVQRRAAGCRGRRAHEPGGRDIPREKQPARICLRRHR
jgi:aspartyl-tRNA(Asn)/glutamyl-tRNA(Gln) amidotransferase subunit A